MEKLVYTYFVNDGKSIQDRHICFEFKSKEDFILHILGKYAKYLRDNDEYFVSFEIFDDIYIGEEEAEEIKNSIFTLEEWWEESKIKI